MHRNSRNELMNQLSFIPEISQNIGLYTNYKNEYDLYQVVLKQLLYQVSKKYKVVEIDCIHYYSIEIDKYKRFDGHTKLLSINHQYPLTLLPSAKRELVEITIAKENFLFNIKLILSFILLYFLW